MEKTLILFKPDCMKRRLAGTILARFDAAELDVLAAKVIALDSAILREHYAHVADKPFFPEIEAFMSERPVLAMILGGEGVVAKVRDLLGPTDSTKAPKGTIRGDLGEDMMRNLVHASDAPETAQAEIKRFFPEFAGCR